MGPVSQPTSAPGARPQVRRTARRPERSPFGLDVAMGMAIPFGNMLRFGEGDNGAELENGVGFSLRLALTLKQFEIVWNMSVLSTGKVRGRITSELRDTIGEVVDILGGDGSQVSREVTLDGPGEPLITHLLAFGYRPGFNPIPEVSVAVPFGLGPVFVDPPDAKGRRFSLGGAGLYIGVLAEYLYGGFLGLGGSIHGSVYVTEPDPDLLVFSFLNTEKLHKDRLAWLSMMTLSLHARVYY